MSKTMSILALLVLALHCNIAVSAQSDDPLVAESDKKCDDALDQAETDLIRKVQNNAILSPASATNQPPQDELSKAMASYSQVANKRAELAQQVIEKKGQIETEKYRQAMEIRDKLHEYSTLDPKRRQEVTLLELAKKARLEEIDNKCWDQADAQYAALVAGNQALASTTNFKTNSLQFARGTTNRMQSQLVVFHRLCLAKPQTQSAFAMATEEMNAKIRNFKIEAEKNLSDINYVESKIPLMNDHFGQRLNEVDQGASLQEQALYQSQISSLAAIGMAMSTASASASGGGAVAATMLSARETLDRIQAIKQQCKNSTNTPIAVPDDLYAEIFLKVNKACRPDASPGNYCVVSSHQNSAESAPANTKSN